nr:MAG TPA: hypothetical protein [Bacteriophage sp.]
MTCKDCRKYNNCLESSRMYPCTSFAKRTRNKDKQRSISLREVMRNEAGYGKNHSGIDLLNRGAGTCRN